MPYLVDAAVFLLVILALASPALLVPAGFPRNSSGPGRRLDNGLICFSGALAASTLIIWTVGVFSASGAAFAALLSLILWGLWPWLKPTSRARLCEHSKEVLHHALRLRGV